MLRIALFLLIFISTQVDAFRIHGPHALSLGPEAYYLVRTRQGGTKQDGGMVGINAKYERIRRWGLYGALEYNGGWGELSGKDAANNSILSSLSQQQVEARGGFNFQFKTGRKAYFLPFVGYGYFYQENSFVDQGLNFIDYFPYASIGAQIGMNLTPCTTVALLVKGDWMLEGNTRIEGIQELGTVKMNMEADWQYYAELPITLRKSLGCHCFYAIVTPFFQLRHFGGLPSFPVDFIDTRYRSYGAKVTVAYDF
jgi:hypothetical protein